MAAELSLAFEPLVPPGTAEVRAQWLVDAIEALVGLLETPSRLAPRALDLAATWPAPGEVPSSRVEGKVWLAAAHSLCPMSTAASDAAWRSAWVLLTDVLAQESLSPFATPSVARHRVDDPA